MKHANTDSEIVGVNKTCMQRLTVFKGGHTHWEKIKRLKIKSGAICAKGKVQIE